MDDKAERFDNLSYMEVLSKDLKVMDASAVSLARKRHSHRRFLNSKLRRSVQVLQGDGACTIVQYSIWIRGRYDIDIDDIERRMDGALASFKTDLAGLRTGRASAGLLEPIMVDAYGQMMPISQVGTVVRAGATLCSPQVWDKGRLRHGESHS